MQCIPAVRPTALGCVRGLWPAFCSSPPHRSNVLLSATATAVWRHRKAPVGPVAHGRAGESSRKPHQGGNIPLSGTFSFLLTGKEQLLLLETGWA